jgi:hypothetical protein
VSRAAPSVYVIVGAPGAGKSSQIHVTLAEPAPRRMIFDIEHEYGRYGRACRLEDIRKALIAAGPAGPFSLVYQPTVDDAARLKRQFDIFCRLAFAAAAPRRPSSGVLFVCDELADVTSADPLHVPAGWSTLARKGRKRYIAVVVGTQRPAEIDKKVWSFQTRLRVGMLAYVEDQRDLAAALMVDRREVAALKPGEWIERDKFTATVTRGSIAWKGGRPVNVTRPGPAGPGRSPDVKKKRAPGATFMRGVT